MGRGRFEVAVLAPFAGAHYAGRAVGGAELQSTYLVRALATAGLRVAHLVRLEEDFTPREQDGVTVVPIESGYDRGGIARRRALLSALRAADAGLYVQRSASFETGIVAAFARVRRRRFVFSASSEADFRLDPVTTRIAGASLDDRKSRLQYRFGLRYADEVVVQTGAQHELLRRSFGRSATVVPSFCEPAVLDDRARSAFLWVGGVGPVKDPLAFLDLARRLPELRFRMLATERGASQLAEELRLRASELPNVELLGPRPRPDALDLYREAIALVNTSHLEGFPNTFLEAWAHATPVLSLRVDPDGVIMRRGLGAVAGGSIETLAQDAARLAADGAAARAAGEAGFRYVRDVHAIDVVSPLWIELVERLLDGRR
jgi:glycosyltransferase involved in cell wall biosynthesis